MGGTELPLVAESTDQALPSQPLMLAVPFSALPAPLEPPCLLSVDPESITAGGRYARTLKVRLAGSIDPAAGGDVLLVLAQERASEGDDLGDPLIGERVIDRPVLTTGVDEAAPSEACEVIRDLGLREAETLGQLSHRDLAIADQLEDPKSRRVSERAEVLRDELGVPGRRGKPKRASL
jgi:hypothetical protein